MEISRSRAFLDVTIDSLPAGRLVLELFNDKAPRTCENFLALCNGSHKGLTYASSPFHRVIDEFMIQGGDITKGDGTGGTSIYGGEFEDENLNWREIDAAGLVCMANRGPGTNSSQYAPSLPEKSNSASMASSSTRFFITLEPTPHLNGKHTVFAHLVSGHEVLKAIAAVPVDRNDLPKVPVLVSRCGELQRKKPAQHTPGSQTGGHGRHSPVPSRTKDRSQERISSDKDGSRRARKDHDRNGRKRRRRSSLSPDETFRGRPKTRSESRSPASARSPSPGSKGPVAGSRDTQAERDQTPPRKHRRVRSRRAAVAKGMRAEEDGMSKFIVAMTVMTEAWTGGTNEDAEVTPGPETMVRVYEGTAGDIETAIEVVADTLTGDMMTEEVTGRGAMVVAMDVTTMADSAAMAGSATTVRHQKVGSSSRGEAA
ncbi:Peptidyl-prolyl cis-trans isomerase D [Sphaceloma murrayae]|uniref:peptidylprolyl isomerase n=1 Tax=Sphaceloma murrayae TaxID=2082308 RepID=A0A2K1QMC7_9PEZI|nr:Peptidyl-prolyl cis-trans isomerase D [Sphaceloma murrayae]